MIFDSYMKYLTVKEAMIQRLYHITVSRKQRAIIDRIDKNTT